MSYRAGWTWQDDKTGLEFNGWESLDELKSVTEGCSGGRIVPVIMVEVPEPDKEGKCNPNCDLHRYEGYLTQRARCPLGVSIGEDDIKPGPDCPAGNLWSKKSKKRNAD